MKFKSTKDKFIIEIPRWEDRVNPWMDEGTAGMFQTLMGLICHDQWGNEEVGFANVIDMGYKGKADQWTGIIIDMSGMEKEEFIKLCDDNGVDWYEYNQCEYCKKDIYGCYTVGKKGDMCMDCKEKKKKK